MPAGSRKPWRRRRRLGRSRGCRPSGPRARRRCNRRAGPSARCRGSHRRRPLRARRPVPRRRTAPSRRRQIDHGRAGGWPRSNGPYAEFGIRPIMPRSGLCRMVRIGGRTVALWPRGVRHNPRAECRRVSSRLVCYEGVANVVVPTAFYASSVDQRPPFTIRYTSRTRRTNASRF